MSRAANPIVRAVAVAALAFACVPQARAQRPDAFDCGSNKITVWLWPKGHARGFSGLEKSDRGLAYAFNGWGNPTSDALDAEAGAGSVAGVEIGVSCVARPAGNPAPAAPGMARVTAPSRLECSFAAHPLIRVLTLPNGARRLDVFLATSELVVTADVRPAGSVLRYARQHCTRSKPRYKPTSVI
jgi:hypothetical protein